MPPPFFYDDKDDGEDNETYDVESDVDRFFEDLEMVKDVTAEEGMERTHMYDLTEIIKYCRLV